MECTQNAWLYSSNVSLTTLYSFVLSLSSPSRGNSSLR